MTKITKLFQKAERLKEEAWEKNRERARTLNGTKSSTLYDEMSELGDRAHACEMVATGLIVVLCLTNTLMLASGNNWFVYLTLAYCHSEILFALKYLGGQLFTFAKYIKGVLDLAEKD